MTQTLAYQTLKTYDNFELRLYKAMAVASSTAPQIFSEIRQSFRPLNLYMQGHNRTRQQIALTAPVLIVPAGTAENVYLTQFCLPSAWNVDTAPLPNGDDVTLLAVPARKIAALRYAGVWAHDNFAARSIELQQAVAKANLTPANAVPDGAPVAARYDGPFWPPFFMRRNEVWLEIA